MRPPPSRCKEHGYPIGGGRSAARANTRSDPATSTANTIDSQSDPDDDDQDAWLASIVEESKESTNDILTEVPSDAN